jgi:flagellar basal-body rod protein FlgG
MAITALYAAATGLRALSTRIDIVANNLANAETTAFKGQRANFEDLMYQTLRQPGTTNANQEISPGGIYVGLGTKLSNTQLDLAQGAMENTQRNLDVGIQGQGFFKVKLMQGIGDGAGYTRNGNLVVNNNGDLVVNIGDGYKLDPPVPVPLGSTDISIATDGSIYATKGVTKAKIKVGQLQLTQFENPLGLNMLGGSIYTETDSSGKPITTAPGKDGAGTILQGYLESSNVDSVKELVTLIKTQRAFELNSQSIQTADQALQTIGNLRRG